MSKKKVIVTPMVGETVCAPETFTCDWASVNMHPNGRVTINVVNGHDEGGPVTFAMYSSAYKVVGRPDAV